MDVVDPRPGAVATMNAPDSAELPDEATSVDEVEPAPVAEAAEPDAVAEPADTNESAETDSAADDVVEPAAVDAEVVEVDAAVGSDAVVGSDAAVGPVPLPATPVTRRRSPLRRAVAIGALTVVAALGVSAFATAGPASGDADQHFIDTAVSQGHTFGSGAQQALVVSAAQKICARKETHSTIADRKATALSSAELGAVTASFTDDARGFTDLALQTYCSR